MPAGRTTSVVISCGRRGDMTLRHVSFHEARSRAADLMERHKLDVALTRVDATGALQDVGHATWASLPYNAVIQARYMPRPESPEPDYRSDTAAALPRSASSPAKRKRGDKADKADRKRHKQDMRAESVPEKQRSKKKAGATQVANGGAERNSLAASAKAQGKKRRNSASPHHTSFSDSNSTGATSSSSSSSSDSDSDRASTTSRTSRKQRDATASTTASAASSKGSAKNARKESSAASSTKATKKQPKPKAVRAASGGKPLRTVGNDTTAPRSSKKRWQDREHAVLINLLLDEVEKMRPSTSPDDREALFQRIRTRDAASTCLMTDRTVNAIEARVRHVIADMLSRNEAVPPRIAALFKVLPPPKAAGHPMNFDRPTAAALAGNRPDASADIILVGSQLERHRSRYDGAVPGRPSSSQSTTNVNRPVSSIQAQNREVPASDSRRDSLPPLFATRKGKQSGTPAHFLSMSDWNSLTDLQRAELKVQNATRANAAPSRLRRYQRELDEIRLANHEKPGKPGPSRPRVDRVPIDSAGVASSRAGGRDSTGQSLRSSDVPTPIVRSSGPASSVRLAQGSSNAISSSTRRSWGLPAPLPTTRRDDATTARFDDRRRGSPPASRRESGRVYYDEERDEERDELDEDDREIRLPPSSQSRVRATTPNANRDRPRSAWLIQNGIPPPPQVSSYTLPARTGTPLRQSPRRRAPVESPLFKREDSQTLDDAEVNLTQLMGPSRR